MSFLAMRSRTDLLLWLGVKERVCHSHHHAGDVGHGEGGSFPRQLYSELGSEAGKLGNDGSLVLIQTGTARPPSS